MKNDGARKNLKHLLAALCLGLACAALNLLLALPTRKLGIPLYLDCVGTILAALLGGAVPSVVTAILTGLLNGLFDPVSIYYALVGALIAVAVSTLRRRRFFRSFRRGAVVWLILFAIGSVVSTALTWFLYAFDFGEAVSAPLAQRFWDDGRMPKLMAQILADALINAVDKGIVLLAACGVFGLLPERFKRFLATLLRSEPEAETPHTAPRRSLLWKVVLVVSVAEVLLAGIASSICYYVYRDVSIRKYTAVCRGVTGAAAIQIDPERVDDFLAQGREADGYREAEQRLYRVKDSFPEVEYIYAYRIEADGCHVVFDLDTEGVEASEVGSVVVFDESFGEMIPTLLAGGEIDPIITNDTYGWLLTVYQPIFDTTGRCVCYVAADISMSEIVIDETMFIVKMLSLFFSASILIMAIMLELVNISIVRPVNAMASASSQFAYDTDEERSESLSRLESLNIRTHDEIENLYAALSRTAADSTGYIREIKEQADHIARLQEAVILDFAEMVEARDQCTGDHIKKTSFYVRGIAEQMKKDGKHPELLTDAYIEKLVRSAPLHDVGKIKISDLILNKPGRLTDEEFEQMKTHTSEGRDILSKTSTNAADGEGYFEEAIEMAGAHHERWDGNGYPNRIGGEEIPLSARIMAVADVFDALVSRRSYKEPFSYEKAISIIREESGTHFDPDVVESFLKVAEKLYQESNQNGKNT